MCHFREFKIQLLSSENGGPKEHRILGGSPFLLSADNYKEILIELRLGNHVTPFFLMTYHHFMTTVQ